MATRRKSTDQSVTSATSTVTPAVTGGSFDPTSLTPQASEQAPSRGRAPGSGTNVVVVGQWFAASDANKDKDGFGSPQKLAGIPEDKADYIVGMMRAASKALGRKPETQKVKQADGTVTILYRTAPLAK